MNIIKTVTITLAFMTSTAFADFTIKDLFISGGTVTTEESGKANNDGKGAKDERMQEDSK